MGKTVPSFRMALEFEIERWKGFRKALVAKEDQEAFEMLMDMCRSFVSEDSNETVSCATITMLRFLFILSPR